MSEIHANPYNQPGSEPVFSAEEPPRQPRGCLFYGCITAVVLFVLGLILMGVLSYVAYNWSDRMIKEYTATTPIKLPPVDLPDEERKALDDRWAAFKTAVDKGEAAELTLSAAEINALLSEDPNLRGKVYVTINNDKISGKLSLPIDFLPLGLGKGRYLNGTATLTVSLKDGELIVHAKELEVNGKTPPDDIKAQLGRENLAREWAKDRKNAETLNRFDTIEIKDGLVHLKARSKAEAEALDKGDTPKSKEGADTPRAKDDDEDKPRAKDSGDEDKPKPNDDDADKPKAKDAPKADDDKALAEIPTMRKPASAFR